MSTPESNRVFNFFQLEDRILLSADQFDADSAEPSGIAQLDQLIALLDAADQSDPHRDSSVQDTPLAPMQELTEHSLEEASFQTPGSAENLESARREIVFIDSDVQDSDDLIDELRHRANNATQWHVVRLSAETDGVRQITDALAEWSNVDAVHIVSHGDGTGLRLGNSRLDSNTLSQHADGIASWAGALDADADLLLYGCDLAATHDGQALIDTIGILAGCDVASSDDATGHQSRGGDWDLEYEYGSIETSTAFSDSLQQEWTGLLGIFTVTNSSSSGIGSFSQAIIDANSNPGLDTIGFNIAGSGLHSILITTPLPTVTDAVIIDGYTQSGSSANTLINGNDAVLAIELNGTGAGNAPAIDLGTGSDGSTIRGLVINRFTFGGIQVSSTGNTIAGNFIGTDSTGLSGLPNQGDGITMGFGGSNNQIGGTSAGERNTIAFNVGSGIVVATSENGNAILGNSIHSNGGLGIDLNSDGVTGNDGGSTPTPDQDFGANNLQNFPTLTTAIAGTSTTIDGTLSSTPGRTFRIEFFAGASADPSGYGEGERYLGFTNVIVDASGAASFNATLFNAVAHGEFVSATATDLTTNDTSEFSAHRMATNVAPDLDNSGIMILATINEDQVGNTGQTIAAIIASAGGDRITDLNAGSVEGIAITSTTSGNGRWQYSIDGGSTWTSFGTVANGSALLLRESDFARFLPDGENQTSASFDFRAWDQTAGLAGAKHDTSINGGTSSFSGTIETASITVADVNDAPVLDTFRSPTLDGIFEDSPAPSGPVGTTISSLIDFASPSGQVDNLNEVDIGALTGIAVTAADSSNGTWHYSINNGANWFSLGAVNDNSARLLAADANTRLSFHPDADYNGLTNNAITFRAWDQTTGTNGGLADSSVNGNTTAFSVASDTASLLVNNSPLLDNSVAMTLTTISEDQVNNIGDSVAAIINSAGGDRITDVNFGPVEGIAQTATNNGNGRWQYSLDGGSSWSNVSAVSVGSSLLLRETDRLRFVPDAENGTPPTVTFRAWDQATGSAGSKVNTWASGGTTPYSIATHTASITVTDVNDAPVLDATRSPALTGIYEDSPAPSGSVGTTISSLIDFASPSGQVDNLDEVDIGALPGIAVTAADSTNGTWHYSIDNGANWFALGAVQDSAARLLAADANTRLAFHPDIDYNGLINNAITFRAWDQTTGINGGTGDSTVNGNTAAFSIVSDTASLLVNDAPILDNSATMMLTTISEDQITNVGDSVAAIISSAGDDRITDVNFDPVEGIALTATDNGNGRWQYSIDGGASWSNVATVSTGSSLLLRDTDRLRFVPDAENGTPPTVTFRAWDQATGSAGSKVNTWTSGGTNPYSIASHTASIVVTDVNDAPVLDNTGAMNLTTLNEDQFANPGNTVASILASGGGNRVTDVDIGAVEGIAITSLSSGNGIWQHSIDGGASWFDITGVSTSSALLLRQNDSVRFVPNGETGTTASFDFHAWDQFAGAAGTLVDATTRGGITPFSIASETASITVTDINDAPITTLSGGITLYTENAPAIQVDSTLTVTDVDSVDFNTGRLTFTISANATSDDRLTIVPGGAVSVRGSEVYYSGVRVGTFAGGLGTSPLVITFNVNSSPSIAQEIGRQVSIFNVSDNPSTAVRTIDATMTDGDGGTSTVSKQTLSVVAADDDPIAVNDHHGLQFDGIDDAANMGSNPVLAVTHSLTMEAWVRPDSYPTSSNIILNREGEYEIGITSSGHLRWALANSNPYPGWAWHDTGYVIPLNQWSHISVVYDNGTVNTYVNGTLVETYHGSGAIGDAHPSLDDFRVGGRQNNPAGQFFSGEIDDVRIWNIARSELEIRNNLNQTLSGTEIGLLGYWQFNDGSGNTTADATANGIVGTLIDGGAGSFGPQWTGYATDEDTPLIISIATGVTRNDLDGDGDTMTVTHVNGSTANVGSTLTLASGGTVTMLASGDFSYDPNGAFDFLTSGQTAIDSFFYQINDGNGGTDIATATVTVTGINDSPFIATNGGTSVAEGSIGNIVSSLMLAAGDLDDTGTGLTFRVTDGTGNGTLTLAGFGNLSVGDTFSQADIDAGRVRYNHDDSETTDDAFSFLVVDGGEDGSSAVTGTFTFAVTLVNDHAVVGLIDIDSATNVVAENAASGTIVGVRATASDGDINDTVSYRLDDDAGGRFSIGAATGVVTVSGPIDFETTANHGITVRATSTDGSAVTMVVSIRVNDVNESPSATADSFSIFAGERLSVADPGVIFNDSDVDGNSIATILVTPPNHGTFSLQPGGAFTYTPDVGFFGRDAFFYQVTDGLLSSNIVRVPLDVIAATPLVTESPATPEPQPPATNPFDTVPQTNRQSDSDTELTVEESKKQPNTSERSTSETSSPAVSALTAPPEPNQNPGGDSEEIGGVGGDPRLPLELTGEAERQFFGAFGSSDGATTIVQSDSPEIQQLERILRQDLQQAIVWSQWDSTEERKETPATIFVGAAGAGMSLFSIGYVFWALRGGALMTVFGSSLPAWRFIDPITMLSVYRSTKTNGDERLDSLIS